MLNQDTCHVALPVLYQLLVQLTAKCNLREPMQFTASNEFCRLSGLLCSYGLYQVLFQSLYYQYHLPVGSV